MHLGKMFSLFKKGIGTEVSGKQRDNFIVKHWKEDLRRIGALEPIKHIIGTHRTVDLDAVACCALAHQYILLHGNIKADELPEVFRCGDQYILADHPLRKDTKGDKSAFALLVSQTIPDPLPDTIKLMEEIDEADSGMVSEDNGRYSLSDFKNSVLIDAIQWGAKKLEIEKKEYSNMEKNMNVFQVGNYKFVQGKKNTFLGGKDFLEYLNKKDPKIIGACYDKLNNNGIKNMGIFKVPGAKAPSFEKLAKTLPSGWYLDPRDYMISWGTKKVPRDNPPEGVKDIEELLTKLEESWR